MNALRPPCLYCGRPTRLPYADGWLHANGEVFCVPSDALGQPGPDLRTDTPATPNLTSVRYIAGLAIFGGFLAGALLIIFLATVLLADAFADGDARPDLDALAAEALEEWGYHGIAVDIAYGSEAQLTMDGVVYLGLAWPSGDFRSCRVLIHENTAHAVIPGGVRHEIGHCVGAPHSDDPASVMRSGNYEFGTVTTADRWAAKDARTATLTACRIAIPQVSR